MRAIALDISARSALVSQLIDDDDDVGQVIRDDKLIFART
jgi:hypothetical protein